MTTTTTTTTYTTNQHTSTHKPTQQQQIAYVFGVPSTGGMKGGATAMFVGELQVTL